MINVEGVYKRYRTDQGPGKWVLRGVSLQIPSGAKVGLIGQNGAGKSTLLRLIGGIDQPTQGRISRDCRISWPIGLVGGLQGSLTGHQNAKFVCRLHGREDRLQEKLAYVKEFSELGNAFDEPVKTYSSGMQARLRFALSLIFDFEVYLIDEVTAVGDAAFRVKSRDAFRDIADRSGLVMAAHSESSLKEFCEAGILLLDGVAHWFDRIDDALAAYRSTLPK